MNNAKTLTEFQRALVEENLGLISCAMTKLPIYLFDSREDAFQIGSIGLMKAARHYDPSRNILFSTYAMPCIINELRMALRHINSSNPPGRTVSYDAPLPNADGDTLSLLDMIPSNDQPADERISTHETLGEVISSPRHMKDPDAFDIIRMVVQNRRQEEIAAHLGITQSAVSRKIRKIRAALIRTVQY